MQRLGMRQQEAPGLCSAALFPKTCHPNSLRQLLKRYADKTECKNGMYHHGNPEYPPDETMIFKNCSVNGILHKIPGDFQTGDTTAGNQHE